MAQLAQIEQRVERIPYIEQRISFQQRSGANLLIRVKRELGGESYFEDFLGQIVNGNYTKPGNLDWARLKRRVILHINKAVHQTPLPGDLVNTDVFVLNVWQQGRPEERQLTDKVAFVTLLIKWEKGAIKLPHTGGDDDDDENQIYIEFESTKLVNGVPPAVESPEIPEEDGLGGPVGGPARRSRRIRERESGSSTSSRSSPSVGPSRIPGGFPGRRERLATPAEWSSGSRDFGDGPDGPLNIDWDGEEEEGGDDAGRRDKGKGRAEKEPLPDTEAEEADENSELLDKLEDRLTGSDENLKVESKEHWDKVKTFLRNHDKEAMQFSLPGLKSPMEGYQAAAVV